MTVALLETSIRSGHNAPFDYETSFIYSYIRHVVANQKSVTAKLLESPQAVKMDNLTVTRLRTECRLRRLPVSGRKRNLVLRLLPFADAILGGSGNTASSSSKDSETATGGSFDGASYAAVAPPPAAAAPKTTTTSESCKSSQPVESTTTELEFLRPFVPLDSLVSGWSNFNDDDDADEDDWTVDAQFARIVDGQITDCRLDRSCAADSLTVGSPPPVAADNPLSSVIDHAGVLTDYSGAADKTGIDHQPGYSYAVLSIATCGV